MAKTSAVEHFWCMYRVSKLRGKMARLVFHSLIYFTDCSMVAYIMEVQKSKCPNIYSHEFDHSDPSFFY